MKTSWMKGVALAAAFALLAPAALAQTTGRIEGRVVTQDGAALPGVTVEITSPAMQGDRIAVTDASGDFRFLNLPPGDYNLTARLEGFTTLEQESINVRLDRAVSLALEMPSAEFGTELTVTGAAPIIDTTSTTSGANFSEELFQDLPVTRTFQGLAFAAPGVVSGGLGNNPSIGGASAAENRYVVDGLDTTDSAFGTIGTTVPFEFIREVEVKTGGYEAEYSGALGGVLNVITKSGGNELEGDIFGYWQDDGLQSDAKALDEDVTREGFTDYDFGGALGGAIIQDKLWYFVAANPSTRDTTWRSLQGVEFEESTDSMYYAGKLTWQLNPNHQLVGTAFGDPTETDKDAFPTTAAGLIADDTEEGADSYSLAYNSTFGTDVFVEALAGSYQQTDTRTPIDNSVNWYRDRTNTGLYAIAQNCGPAAPLAGVGLISFSPTCTGGTFVTEDGDRSRDEARLSATVFLGPHELKLGGHLRDVEYTDFAHYPNPSLGTPFVDSNGTVVDPDGLVGGRFDLFAGSIQLWEYDQRSVGTTDEQAIFAQDTWRIGDYFTLNLGVRADASENTGEGSNDPTNTLPRSLDFGFGDMIAPRIGFTWDALRNGRSKLYGHWGQFYESVPLDINVRAFGNENFNVHIFGYPANANPANGIVPTYANPGNYAGTVSFGTATGVDPNVDPMYTEETLLGFEYEIVPNLALGLRGTMRDINDVIEDISVDAAHTYFITNPGGDICDNPLGDVLDDVTEQPVDCVNFPEPTRDYEALELTLNKRFSNNWQLFGSAVYSKNEGNYGGLFRQDNGQLDPNITSLYDLPSLLEGAFGLLPNDREYQFKLYGSYVWPFRLTTGFFAQYLDGTPISQLGAHDLYGTNERFVTSRGSAGRTPDIWSLDVSLQYPLTLGGTELRLLLDVFNLTDQQEVTVVDQTWTFAAPSDPNPNCGGPDSGAGCPLGNDHWGEPDQFQSPRTVRLGARLSF